MKAIRLLVGAAFLLGACTADTAEGPRADAPEATPQETDSAAGEATAAPPDKEKDTGLDFRVETFDGDTFRLADHRGTPVVVNFWESW